MEIKNNEIWDKRKYHEYIDLGRETRQYHLMFSELIDNSIGSFDDHFTVDDWEGKTLTVDIEINNPVSYEKDNLNYGKNGIGYYPESYIKVSDNAYGIKTDKINTSLKLNEKNPDTKSSVHEHGRGLKQSAFYFGLGVIVNTNNGEVSRQITNLPMEKGIYSDVMFSSVDINKDEIGTEVIIKPLRTKRRITKTKLETIVKALSERYGRLMESGKLEINITHKIENNTTEFIPVEKKDFKKVDAVSTLSEDSNHSLERRQELWNKSMEKFENRLKSQDENNTFNEFEKLKVDVIEKLKNIFLSTELETDILWKNEIEVSEGVYKEATFWSNSRAKMAKQGVSKYKSYRGLTIYQGHRAILHPPNGEESSNYIAFISDSKMSGNADYKFAGSIDIAGTNIETSSDKSNIEFNSPDEQDVFHDQVKLVYDIFTHFYEDLKTSARDEGGEDVDKIDYLNSKDNLERRFSKFDGNISDVKILYKDEEKEKEPYGFVYKIGKTFKGSKEEYSVRLIINPKKIDEGDGVIKTLFTYGDNDNHEIEATLFTGHQIWKKFDAKTKFFSEVMIVIANVILLQEIIGRNKGRVIVEANPELTKKPYFSDLQDIFSTTLLLNDAGDDVE